MVVIAFDVDDTLIDSTGNPIEDTIQVLKWFVDRDYRVLVWSGAGTNHAKEVVSKLGLSGVEIGTKFIDSADIAFDDDRGMEHLYYGLKVKVFVKA